MIKFIFITLASYLITMSAIAQSVSHNQVYETQKNIENTIKGTLDGVVTLPRTIQNGVRQLVFPNSTNGNFSSNPWSQSRPRQIRRPNYYGGLPKGNPWAPIGAPISQGLSQSQTQKFEKNPYTDSNSGGFRAPGVGNSFSNNSLNAFQSQPSPYNQGFNQQFNNGFNDGSNGSFSTPFGDSYFPSNNFLPGINNGNNSFPFMPW